jgi:hypothetical protein
MSVGSTELIAEVPALRVPEQKTHRATEGCPMSVGSTELKAEVPALPVPEQKTHRATEGCRMSVVHL